jgi:hypothetical protein
MRGSVMIAGVLLGIFGFLMSATIVGALVGAPTMAFGFLIFLVGLFLRR